MPPRLRLSGADLPLRAVRDADPRCFAMVMATGIVSVALRLTDNRDLSAVLLWVSIAAFAVLVVASAWRIAAFGSQVRGELGRPNELFGYFAFAAAASVLGARLAGDGPPTVVAVLTAVTAVAWIALCGVATGLIPALVVFGTVRWRRGLTPRGFRREWWMIVFPAGMYATASMRTGAVAGMPAIRDAGTGATWIAAAVWAAVFIWMTGSTAARLRAGGTDPAG
jgi:tellurite resistance protein TehA-like permease